MLIKRQYLIVLTALFLAFVFACDNSTDSPVNNSPYPEPVQTNDGWITATLDQVGIRPDSLLSLIDRLSHTQNHLIHSILIVKDFKLVFEEYWPGKDMPADFGPGFAETDFDRDILHYTASVSKSVTSALMGIAIDKGQISGTDESLFSFFPEYNHLKTSENEVITLDKMLSMSSGYYWNEFKYEFSDPRDSHYMMFASNDPLGYLLGREMVSAPGTAFLYNSGDTNLLGEIIRRVSSSNTLIDFAEEYLFSPLEITSYHWNVFPRVNNMAFASGGLFLRPRDMAKIGALYMNNGVWKGARILSPEWIVSSTRKSIDLEGSRSSGYGYQWWLGRFYKDSGTVDYFLALGWGGQYVICIPETDMIIVFTAGAYYDSKPISYTEIIENYILKAVK